MKQHVNDLKRGLRDRRTRIALLTYLLFCLPRFTDLKDDRELHYHMRQSLGLLITALALQGAISILGYWGMPYWRVWPVRIFLVYLLIIGISNVLKGRLAPLPWIGKYAERIF